MCTYVRTYRGTKMVHGTLSRECIRVRTRVESNKTRPHHLLVFNRHRAALVLINPIPALTESTHVQGSVDLPSGGNGRSLTCRHHNHPPPLPSRGQVRGSHPLSAPACSPAASSAPARRPATPPFAPLSQVRRYLSTYTCLCNTK